MTKRRKEKKTPPRHKRVAWTFDNFKIPDFTIIGSDMGDVPQQFERKALPRRRRTQ